MKKYLCFLIAMLIFCTPFASAAEETLIVDVEEYFNNTVIPQNQRDEDPSNDDIQIKFNKFTGTLTVSGEGIVDKFFSRDWESVDGSYERLSTNKTIRRLIIEEGITDIYNSFNDLLGIKEVRLPQSLENIVASFNGSTVSKVSKISNESTYIKNSFNDSTCLKSINISDSSSIQESFNNAAALKSVDLSADDMLDCFNNCDSLKTTNLTLKSMHDSFKSCPRLKKVAIQQRLQNADYSFEDCPRLEKIQLGKNTYTVREFWEKFSGPIEDDDVYGEDWEVSTDLAKVYPQKYVYIVPGGIMIFAFGAIFALSIFIKKKK